MNVRFVFAIAAALVLPVSAQIATVRPPAPKLKWDDMDLGPFFSGCYRFKDTNSFKGVAIAVGTKEAPATILFDTELLRFHAAWEGGLAAFARQRGGLEGTIKSDGEVRLSTGWANGWGSEIKDDARPNHQGSQPDTKWRGIFVNRDKTVLSYSVGKQNILELPGSEVRDGQRIFTRTFTVSAGVDAQQLLIVDAGAQSRTGANGSVLIEKDGTVIAIGVRGTVSDGKIVAKENGRIVFQIPALKSPATFQIAMASAFAQEAEKLANLVSANGELPNLATWTRPGAARWGAALINPGKVAEDKDAYVVDDIPFPENDPFRSWFRPGGHDFFPDGTCAIVNMSGDVWLVSGLDAKLEKVQWKRFASGLFQPLGCKVVDGKVYVLGRDQITRLHDMNNDGEVDFYENFNNGCVVTDNYHEFALDLQTDTAGNFYYAKGSPWTPTNRSPHQGTLLKVSRDGAKLEIVATGLRAPNGLGMGPGDLLTCSDNQGHWMPANRLNLVKPGGFYGMVSAAHKVMTFKRADGSEFKANPSSEDARKQYKTEFWENSPIPVEGYDAPLVWLPMDIDNSPGGEVWVPGGAHAKWGPWAGKMLHMSYGKCSLFGVMTEKVDGEDQGALVRFPVNFKSGIQRGRFSPVDGQLYMTGLSVWQSSAAKDGCFQRVRYTGKSVTMPIGIATKADGVEVQFSAPLDASAGDSGNWSAEQWNYKWTGKYGSPEFSPTDPEKKSKEPVEVEKATLSGDKKSVHLQLSNRVPAHTLRLKANAKAADGADVKVQIDQTINRLPGQKTAGK
jgi:hypothetical protein